MLKVDALEKVRVMSVDETARTNDEGELKRNSEFPGCKQWGVRIRYPERVLEFADGSEETDYAERRVSVWSQSRPDISEGSYARLSGVRIGAYSSGNRADLYVWATGLEPVDTPSTTSSLGTSFGGDDDNE